MENVCMLENYGYMCLEIECLLAQHMYAQYIHKYVYIQIGTDGCMYIGCMVHQCATYIMWFLSHKKVGVWFESCLYVHQLMQPIH